MRKSIPALGLLGFIVVVPAFAQQPPSANYPAPCDEAKVTKADRDRAHTVFLSGKQFLEESNYDKAIGYFEDAYTIDCSVHGILTIIATAYERKGDRRQAVHALEEYQKRAPNASDHDIVERRIKNLNDQVAQEPTVQPVAPAPPPPSSVAPAASPSPEVSGAAPLATGTTPSAMGEGIHSSIPWVLVGVGGVAVAGGIVLVVLGSNDISTAEGSCPGRMNCAPAVADQGNRGRTLEPIGFIVGGVGLAAGAAGLLWHFTETPANTSASLRVSPMITPGYAGISLSGGL